MSSNIPDTLFEAYGVQPTQILQPQKGYRNTSYAAQTRDGTVNVIVYKQEPGTKALIKRTNAVGNFLAANGLPARCTLDPRILKLQFGQNTRYASLYNYLPGTTIPWDGYTKHHIKVLGMCMGRIHASTTDFDGSRYPNVVDEYMAIHERMQAYFSLDGVQAALQKKIGLGLPSLKYLETLKACRRLPNQQVLHMDLVRSNVLFSPAKQGDVLTDGPVAISGIIDFEKAAYGHPVFDLARTYAFLLVDCKYKTADKIEKYFFRSGYAKRGGELVPVITYKNQDVLEQLTNLFLTYDFYKFLRHNPYESLPENEHFMRTRDILIARGVVEKI